MTSDFGFGALSQKGLESLGAGELVKAGSALLGIEILREELFARLAQVFQPFFVFRGELIFQLFAKALRQGRALAAGGDGNLKGSALDDGRIEKVAE